PIPLVIHHVLERLARVVAGAMGKAIAGERQLPALFRSRRGRLLASRFWPELPGVVDGGPLQVGRQKWLLQQQLVTTRRGRLIDWRVARDSQWRFCRETIPRGKPRDGDEQ